MSDTKTQWILFGTVLAVILGALGGYYFPPAMISINFLATLFLNALKVIVFPLILTSIVVGITSLGDVRKVGIQYTGLTLHIAARIVDQAAPDEVYVSRSVRD